MSSNVLRVFNIHVQYFITYNEVEEKNHFDLYRQIINFELLNNMKQFTCKSNVILAHKLIALTILHMKH